ncbi:MAG: hypothetical protein J5I53_09790 [Bradyrhizobiaceae bacterium]|nr:hypothetical protein [Bradyrhizobiaceae bacterium]
MQIVTLATVLLVFIGRTTCLASPSDTTAPPLTKNPTTAVLLSLALPGLGQYYTEQYWKIPLFTGTCGTTAFLFFYNNQKFNEYSRSYDAAVAEGASSTVVATLRSKKESYRDNRDLSGVIFLTAYVLAAVDSYVGAHLFDFDVSDDVSLGITPDQTSLAALHLQFRW